MNGQASAGGTAIICGIDGSADSFAALDFAERFARRLRARLVLVHVVEPVHMPYAAAAPFGGMSNAGVLATEEERVVRDEGATRLLEQAAAAAGVGDAERQVATGHAAERLAEIADDEHAELIVVGSRGRGAFKAALLGSVSNSLIGIARCPVVVVPCGVADAA